MHEKQKEILSLMTPDQKIHIAQRLYDTAFQLKGAALRSQHPHWSEEKVKEKVREIFIYARS
ncbi:MAG: hypothetical protein HYS08_03130 [Chlamydiae bacterium]|nr:hypothetical protein [Chlamydiota bacterium]